jgi:tRNA(adenine34) deaminase
MIVFNCKNKDKDKDKDKDKESYMGTALQLASQSLAFDEVPVGAIIVCDISHKIVGVGHNMVIHHKKTHMHAEMVAINMANEYFDNYRLPNCSLYVTLEPCIMCCGAIIHARLSNIIYGASDTKNGMCKNDGVFSLLNKHTMVTSGILSQDCAQILRNFFQSKRNNN